MTDDATLTELNTRIAAIRENIRVLIEQAAAYSGAADQERNLFMTRPIGFSSDSPMVSSIRRPKPTP